MVDLMASLTLQRAGQWQSSDCCGEGRALSIIVGVYTPRNKYGSGQRPVWYSKIVLQQARPSTSMIIPGRVYILQLFLSKMPCPPKPAASASAYHAWFVPLLLRRSQSVYSLYSFPPQMETHETSKLSYDCLTWALYGASFLTNENGTQECKQKWREEWPRTP